MNGYSTGPSPYDYENSRLSPQTSSPNGKNMPGGYKRNMMNGLDKDAPRFNPNQAQRSAVVDLKDPIQVHLLTETALSDSKQYEILAQEEVDDLKKQIQLMVQRVSSKGRNLAIQSKYRDAAISMVRLCTPSGGSSQPDDGRQLAEAEAERRDCERKCEILATELFDLEKALLAPQRRLLEHTAGILQLTHKVSKRKNQLQNSQLVNGIPGSPESLYTYSHSRNSLDPAAEDNYFEDPSLYQLDPLDGLQTSRQPRRNAIEIPTKSPIREQTNQLRGEMDRMREENATLVKSVLEMERTLESLNGSLRDIIIKFNPDVNNAFLEPPRQSDMQGSRPGEMLRSQVGYLESGIVAVQAEQESFPGGNGSGDQRGGEEQPVLTDLWSTIQTGFASIQQEKDDRRKTRQDKGLPDDDDMSDDEDIDTAEPYSLPAFSTRVQWLYRQTSTLKNQKYVLKRQIKQQRELNNKSDAEKDEMLQKKQEEVEQSRELVDRADKEAMDAQTMLTEALEDAERTRGVQAELEERTAKMEMLEAQLKKIQDESKKMLNESKNSGAKVADVDAKMSSLSSQLEEAKAAKATAEETTKGLQKELKQKKSTQRQNEDEMEALNMTLAELKTEVTIARAELDGAYGSRAERAADVAALKNNAEVVKLQNQITKLKKELAGTVEDLESITKETLGAERETQELESKLDEALSAKAAVEADADKVRERMAKLQEELDGERLRAVPGAGGSARPGAGASMLSEQFRATMREERKKFQEDIKEERSRCRKLEEELSRLKRSQGHGKSPLSPR